MFFTGGFLREGMQALQWVHEQSLRTLAILYLLVSLLVPWGVGTTTLPAFDATFFQARWWVGQANYLPGESLEFLLLPDVMWLHHGEASFFAVVSWQVSTALIAAGTLLVLLVEYTDWDILTRVPVDTALTAVLGLSGVGFCIAAIGLSLTGIPGVTIPVSGVLLIGAAIHLHSLAR